MNLSAEPLVGLKQTVPERFRDEDDFQPNPSWV